MVCFLKLCTEICERHRFPFEEPIFSLALAAVPMPIQPYERKSNHVQLNLDFPLSKQQSLPERWQASSHLLDRTSTPVRGRMPCAVLTDR